MKKYFLLMTASVIALGAFSVAGIAGDQIIGEQDAPAASIENTVATEAPVAVEPAAGLVNVMTLEKSESLSADQAAGSYAPKTAKETKKNERTGSGSYGNQ